MGTLVWNKPLPNNNLPENTLGVDACGNAVVAGSLWNGSADLGAGVVNVAPTATDVINAVPTVTDVINAVPTVCLPARFLDRASSIPAQPCADLVLQIIPY